VNRGQAPGESLGIAAPDAKTVVIRLEHPVPYLPDLLAHYGVVPVPAHAVRRWGEAWTQPGHHVSNGPFRLAEWRLGDRLVLVKNPRFYDAARVCLDRVVYLPTNDYVSAERQVKRGELDLNAAFSASRIRYLRGAGGMGAYVRSHPWTDLVYVIFNEQGFAPFRDLRVRQALAMAIDREFIARKLLGAGQTPVDAFTPPGMGGLPAAPDWAALSFPERQARAKRLLAEAGYGPGRPLRFQLKTFFSFERVTPVIQADWRAIGVDVTLATSDIPVFFGDLQAGAFQAGLTDWIADYPDPTNFLNLMRHDEPGANYGGFVDHEYDRLVGAAEREADVGVRARLLQAAERRMLQAAPIAPVWVNPCQNLVSPRVTGWVDNIPDVHPKRWVCFRNGAE
jgi:oligopeptide transport system substrate-binding protein